MPSRRRHALFLLMVILLAMLPTKPMLAESMETAPTYVPVLHTASQRAVIDGDRLFYVTTSRELVTYDLLNHKELGRLPNVREANMLTMLDQLYLLDGATARIFTFDVSGELPVQTGEMIISGCFSNEDWEQGPLVRIDGQRLLTMARGKIFLFNEQTGQIEWTYDGGDRASNEFVVMGNHVFFQLNMSTLRGVAIGGDLEFSAETGGWWPPIVDTSGPEPALLYVTRGSQSVTRLHFAADGRAVTETWVETEFNGRIGNLSQHDDKLFYSDNGRMVSRGLVTKEKEYYDTPVFGQPYWHQEGSDAYRMLPYNHVQEVRDDKVTFGTSLPEPVHLVASAENGFVLRELKRDWIWVFAKAKEEMPMRELSFGQSHLLTLQHTQDGPVSFNLSLELSNPALYVDVQVFSTDETGNWRTVQRTEITDDPGYAFYNFNMPAATFMVMVTAGTKEAYNADLVAANPEWAESIRYQFSPGIGLELGTGDIPPLRFSDPWPTLELWGYDGSAASATINLQTDPGYWVYLLNSDVPLQADEHGKVSQAVQLEDTFASAIQAMAGTGDHAAMATLPIYRHWVSRRPGEAPLLSRSPAINIPVPDASKIDLEYSLLEANKREVPLYVDLKNNRLYGVPDWSLPTGKVQFSLVLAGKPEVEGTDPVLLDAVSWEQEIIGKRTGVLWIGKKNSTINGTPGTLEAAPYIHTKSASTMLPMRFLADVMGARIDWNATTRKVTFKLDHKTVVVTMGSRTATVDGKSVTMPTAPAIINGRTFLPLRFVLENLGAKVDWNGQLRQIIIQAY